MRKRCLGIVHQKQSTTGEVGYVLRKKNIQFDLKRPICGEFLSRNLNKYDALVIFGGPMSANDDHLVGIMSELKLVERWLRLARPFLGICLGAQLLSRVLGGNVYSDKTNLVEIGWYPIYPNPGYGSYLFPLSHVYHWHKEGFEVPRGIDVIAESAKGPFIQQAFKVGDKCIGTQFHPEMELQMMKRWLERAGDMLCCPGAKSRKQHLQGLLKYQRRQRRWLENLISNWFE